MPVILPPRLLTLLQSREDGNVEVETGVSGWSLFWIFAVILIIAAGAFLTWMRSRNSEETASGLFNLDTTPLRLSMDDDGPPAEAFIRNNASTDSLPADSHDIPFFPAASEEAKMEREIAARPYSDGHAEEAQKASSPPRGHGFAPSHGRYNIEDMHPSRRSKGDMSATDAQAAMDEFPGQVGGAAVWSGSDSSSRPSHISPGAHSAHSYDDATVHPHAEAHSPTSAGNSDPLGVGAPVTTERISATTTGAVAATESKGRKQGTRERPAGAMFSLGDAPDASE